MICIYCLKDKDEASYKKAEHVIPQSFGVFRDNFTIKKMICDECNQFFGDNLELVLARDSLEGYERQRHGLKTESEFKTLGKASKTIFQVEDGPAKGAWAYLQNEDGYLIQKPLPQVGFLNANGEYEYFLLEKIPEKEILEKNGFQLKEDQSVRIFQNDLARAQEILLKKGYNIKAQGYGGTVDDEGKRWGTTLYGRMDIIILRAMSKITFNYLAFWEGSDVALRNEFNDMRNFVRYGKVPDYPLCVPTNESLLADEPVEGKRRLGHIVTLGYARNNRSIVSQLTLWNNIKYKTLHALNLGGKIKVVTRGHFFAPNAQAIIPLVNESKPRNPDDMSY